MLSSRILRTWAVSDEDGATAVEYALMVALIAVVIIGAVTALGLALPGLFDAASDGLT
jgi:pilus assembly protein Flp/PilA